MSIVATLSACSSSGGTNRFIESLTETPLVSKPLDTQGLQQQAASNVAVIAKTELGVKDNLQLKDYQISIGDKTYRSNDKVDLKDLGANNTLLAPTVTVTNIQEKFNIDHTKDGKPQTAKVEADRKAYLYQQQYSIVGVLEPLSHTINNQKIEDFARCTTNCDNLLLKGEMSKTLPTKGSANYTGVAWTRNQTDAQSKSPAYTIGSLSYNVDFEQKKGSGEIIGADRLNNIQLKQADIAKIHHSSILDGQKIEGSGIIGDAVQNDKKGSYQLGFFGDQAKEIAGFIDMENTGTNIDVVFSGTKK